MDDEIVNGHIIREAREKLPLPSEIDQESLSIPIGGLTVFRFKDEKNPVYGEVYPVTVNYARFNKQRVGDIVVGWEFERFE